jgi:NAD(P)-dependent dehydrogenase (short-subunit alcohol dehydrogenase family)
VDIQAPAVKSLLDYSGKVVVVTGAGNGLGGGIAARFAEAGASVIVHYRRSAAGAAAVAAHIETAGGRAQSVGADLTDPAGAAGLIRKSVNTYGRVDVLVNNAGSYPHTPLLDMTLDQWENVLADNLRTMFLTTQAFARQIITQGGGGAIVNITSIEADNPAPSHAHYDAAKGGALMLTRVSALELAAHDIRVNAVAPGLIGREGLERDWPEGVERWQRTAPLKRLGRPDDVADACLFLASPGARWITGASLTVDGGVLTHQIY